MENDTMKHSYLINHLSILYTDMIFIIWCNFLQGFAEVETLLKKEGICLAVTEKLIKDSGVAAAPAYDKIVNNIKRTNARGKQEI